VFAENVGQTPEVNWTMPSVFFESNSGSIGTDVKQTNDGGFIVVGKTVTIGDYPKNKDGFLLKADSKGNVIWKHIYPSDSMISGRNTSFSSVDLTDSGYIVVGDNFIFKVDGSGGIVWKKELGDKSHLFSPSSNIYLSSVQTTSKGNYIVAGSYRDNINNTYYLYTAEYDTDGNTIWYKLSNSSNHASFVSVKQITDGFLVVTELKGSVYVLKMDLLGNKIWEKTYSGLQIAFGYSGIETKGGYIIAGSTSNGHYSGYLLKIDENGNKIWDKVYTNYSGFYSVKETLDGGFILLEDLSVNLLKTSSVIKIDDEGNIQWSKENPFYTRINAIEQTEDVGYIITGYNDHSNGKSLYLAKLKLNNASTAQVITGVSLDRSSASIIVGSDVTLTANIDPTNATNKNVTWKSSNIAVATVDANGKVIGVSDGTATIIVITADGSKTATCTLTVTENDTIKQNIQLDKEWQIIFNQPVDASTLQNNIVIRRTDVIFIKEDSFPISPALDPNDPNVVIVKHSMPFVAGATYELSVNVGIKNMSGESLSKASGLSFTTLAE